MCIIFISFQSNLEVLYLLKYECSNDRKYVRKNIFLYFPILFVDFDFLISLFKWIAWL